MKYSVRAHTTNPLKGIISVTLHDRQTAEDVANELRAYIANPVHGGLYSWPGIATINVGEVTEVDVVELPDENENET